MTALLDTKVVVIFAAAAAFVGVNVQCEAGVTPVIVTISEAAAVVDKELTSEVVLLPSGSVRVRLSVTIPVKCVACFSAALPTDRDIAVNWDVTYNSDS